MYELPLKKALYSVYSIFAGQHFTEAALLARNNESAMQVVVHRIA
jgi:hypothetical protein